MLGEFNKGFQVDFFGYFREWLEFQQKDLSKYTKSFSSGGDLKELLVEFVTTRKSVKMKQPILDEDSSKVFCFNHQIGLK